MTRKPCKLKCQKTCTGACKAYLDWYYSDERSAELDERLNDNSDAEEWEGYK